MATEHDFAIISKDGMKLKAVYDYLNVNETPEGVCIYATTLKEFNEYKILKGILRHTTLDEFMTEVRKVGVEIDNEDYLVMQYEFDDSVYLENGDRIVIVRDWYPRVEFTGEALKLP